MAAPAILEEMVLDLMVKGAIDRKTLQPRFEALARELSDRPALNSAIAELTVALASDDAHAYHAALTILESIRVSLSDAEPQGLAAIPTSLTYDRDADEDVLASLHVEIDENCQAMEHDLLLLERSPDSHDTVQAIMGHLHSMKGTAGFVELHAVQRLAHVAESALASQGEAAIAGGVTSVLFRVVDMIRSLIKLVVEHAQRGGRRPLKLPPTFSLLFKDLLKLHDGSDVAGSSAAVPVSAVSAVAPGLSANSRASAIASQSLTRSAALPKQDDAELYEEFATVMNLDVDDNIFGNLVLEDAPAAAAPADTAQRETKAEPEAKLLDLSGQVRVPMERLDGLGEIVSEVMVAYTQLLNDPAIQGTLTLDLERKLSRVSNALRTLQGNSMGLRMFPFNTVLTPLRRTVRDLSDAQGKDVEITTLGGETELDKGVLQDLSDPLLHLIRNAIDHGLETPEERQKAGKSPKARITLQADSRRGRIAVSVGDDGRGLNRERIIAKAIERGLIQSTAAAGMTDAQVWELIFAPGFSTAETITQISGRGVGMDVVKRRVERLNGTLQVESTAGQGTTITMTVPLTLAMFDGLLVRVGELTYIVPQSAIGEVIRPRATQVDTVHQTGVMLTLRGQSLPLVRLQDYVGQPGAKQHPCDGTVLISRGTDAPYALMVDAVIGRQPVVLRSISEALPNYHGVSGCAILGDGRLGLVLDMEEIHARSQRSPEPVAS